MRLLDFNHNHDREDSKTDKRISNWTFLTHWPLKDRASRARRTSFILDDVLDVSPNWSEDQSWLQKDRLKFQAQVLGCIQNFLSGGARICSTQIVLLGYVSSFLNICITLADIDCLYSIKITLNDNLTNNLVGNFTIWFQNDLPYQSCLKVNSSYSLIVPNVVKLNQVIFTFNTNVLNST